MMRRTRCGGIIVATVLMASALPAQAAAQEQPSRGADHSFDATFSPANWRWAETLPGTNKTFESFAPLIFVNLGRDGDAVWAAKWKVAGSDRKMSMRFEGLPRGVKVRSAGLPRSLSSGARAETCRRSGTSVVCELGDSDAGREAHSAVRLVGSRALPLGEHKVTATLLADGQLAQGTAGAEFVIIARQKTPTEFMMARTGQSLVTAQQPLMHKLSLYRLSGSRKATTKRLTVRNVVDSRLRSGVRVRSKAWQCSGASCSTRTAVKVGTSTPAIGVLYRVRNSHVAKWPKAGTSQAHEAKWWSRFSVGGTSTRFRQQLALLRLTKAPKPEYRNAKQVLNTVRRADLTTVVQQQGPARVGGRGLYSVQVSNGGSRRARALRLRLRPPSHTRITKVQTGGRWSCRKDICTWRGLVRPKQALPPVKVLLKSMSMKAPVRKQRFVAMARWKSVGAKELHKDKGVDRNDWLRPLRVEASATNDSVHSQSGIRTQLSANIKNAAGSQVHYRWTQISGPPVNWVGHRSGSVGEGDTAAARFTPPTVKKSTKLRFRVAVKAAGARVVDTVGVVAVPSGRKAEKWNPRLQTSVPRSPEELAKRLQNTTVKDRKQALKTQAAATPVINGKGVTVARPGQRVMLRVRKQRLVPGAAFRKTTWRVNGRKPTKKMRAKTSKRGKVLRLTAPKTPKTLVVTARNWINKDRRVDIGELVVVQPRQPRTSTAAAVQSQTLAATTTEFCAYFDVEAGQSVSVSGVTVEAASVQVSGEACTDVDASVTINGPSMQLGGVTVSDVTLTLKPSTITLAVGSITLPEADGSAVPPIDVSGSLTSTWSGSLSGTLSATGLSSIPYLGLPDGWAVSAASFSYASSSFSMSVTATGPQQAQAQVSGSIGTDGSFSLDVSAHNAVTVTGEDGSQAVFGGSGSLARSSTGAFTYDVELDMTTSTFQVLPGVTLQSASIDWSDTGLDLSAGATVTIGSEAVAFTVAADIDDATDWTATITTTATASVGSLPLASLSGTLGYDTGTFTFNVTADVTVDAVSSFLGLDIATASVSITNMCAASDTSCTSGQLQLALDVTGSVTVFSDTIDIDTTINVDLTTGTFDADFSLAGADFGPSEAQLNDVSFFVADDGASDPQLANNPCATASGSGTVYGFTAQATILSDVTFDVTGVYIGASQGSPTGSGYCFYGQVQTSDIDELDGVGLDASLNFLYSTAATTVDSQVISADSPTMWANMTMPSQLQTYLGSDVTGFTVLIELVTSGGKVTGLTIDGDVDLSAYVAGSATDLPAFELTTIGVSLQVSSGTNDSLELSFDADGVLTTPGNSAGSMTSSSIDFDVSIGLELGSGSDGGSLNIAANLEDAAPVANAFGVAGLTIQQLGIAADIGFDALLNSSLTISATNLELPPNIAGPIGLSSTAPIDFSLTVGATAPCFYISIGTPDQTTNAAINWGGAGVLEAYYFKLLLAPLGNCTESDGTAIQGNFAVDFQGYIFGDSVDISGEVEIVPSFSADLSVDVGSFNVAGLDFQQTIIDLDFDPTGGKFDLEFSGGANLWSAITVSVSGSVDIDLSASDDNIDITFDGSMTENLFGIFQSEIDVDLDVDAGMSNGSLYLNTLDVSLAGDVQVLIFEVYGSFTLDYSDGSVQRLSGSVGAKIDLFVLDFSVELAFIYDPATTGNEDLAITITGSSTLDLWIFSVTVSVSFTVDIDASFLASSEYHPAPPQQVTAPSSVLPDLSQRDWAYVQQQFQANNLGWLANQAMNYQAVSDAANASTVNSPNDAFDQLWEPGVFTSTWTEYTLPSKSWPGAYTLNFAQDSDFWVAPSAGQATVGQTTASDDTYSELEVTATLPESPLVEQYKNTSYTTSYNLNSGGGIGPIFPPWYPEVSCSGTQTWTVQIPDVANTAPGNWAWVMLDTNWRLYGSSLRETADLMLKGWQQVPKVESDIPFPENMAQGNDGFTFDCGYDDFTSQTSLYDFMDAQDVPWSALPPNFTAGEVDVFASDDFLQPAWGSGWQPYDLDGLEFGSSKAFNVQVEGSGFQCDASESNSMVNITNAWGQLWSDPNDDWVAWPDDGYVQLQSTGNLQNPWSLHLFNGSGQELRWNGNAWITVPSGGWSGAQTAFSPAGQLYSADENGVIYESTDGHLTYLAFSGSNTFATQIAAGASQVTGTYVPAGSLNVCDDGQLVFANPNADQNSAEQGPFFNSQFTSTQTFNVWINGQSGDGWSGLFPCTPAAVTLAPVYDSTALWGDPNNDAVSLPAGGYLQVQHTWDTANPWSLNMYNAQDQELRWNGGAWITQPAGGWTSESPFAPAGQLYGADDNGVIFASSQNHFTYLAFDPTNSLNSQFVSGASSPTYTYTPVASYNSCTNSQLVFSSIPVPLPNISLPEVFL